MKVLELHRKALYLYKSKFGFSDYAIAWQAFIKGLIVGSLITYYMN